jgi:hypothetical protein
MTALRPESPNECWLCAHSNLSCASLCERCGGATIHTRVDNDAAAAAAAANVQWAIETIPLESRLDRTLNAIRNLDNHHHERAAVKIGIGMGAARRQAKAAGIKLSSTDGPHPAVIIVKAPAAEVRDAKNKKEGDEKKGEEKKGDEKKGEMVTGGTRTRFSYWAKNQATQGFDVRTCEWGDATKATFWDQVNRILDLDKTNPVGKLISVLVDHQANCD